MFFSFDTEPFSINSIQEFKLETILDLSDITAIFYVNKDYLKTEEEKSKFDEFAKL